TIDWTSELTVKASIHTLTAQLEYILQQPAEIADLELQAQGEVSYTENRLSAQNLAINWGENEIKLNGEMTETSPLTLSLNVPDLATLSINDYFSGDFKAALAISGNITQRLNIQVKDIALNHRDFGNWTNSDQGLISIPVKEPLATSVTSLCLSANTRRTSANLCVDTSAANSRQTTHITGTNLPLA